MKPSTYLQNLQLSTNWRAQFNPLRGLTIQLLVAMLANRARQLQSTLKIGHHAAFRMAEGEAAETELA